MVTFVRLSDPLKLVHQLLQLGIAPFYRMGYFFKFFIRYHYVGEWLTVPSVYPSRLRHHKTIGAGKCCARSEIHLSSFAKINFVRV